MAKAILIDDREWERDYKISTGDIITLKLEEDYSQITFWNKDQQLGKDRDFIFEDIDDINNAYLLARMYIYLKYYGLGRAAVEFFKESSGALIYCRPHDGITRSDGSHLTNDALKFVTAMQNARLIEKEGYG